MSRNTLSALLSCLADKILESRPGTSEPTGAPPGSSAKVIRRIPAEDREWPNFSKIFLKKVDTGQNVFYILQNVKYLLVSQQDVIVHGLT
jgi:hypothetical protein